MIWMASLTLVSKVMVPLGSTQQYVEAFLFVRGGGGGIPLKPFSLIFPPFPLLHLTTFVLIFGKEKWGVQETSKKMNTSTLNFSSLVPLSCFLHSLFSSHRPMVVFSRWGCQPHCFRSLDELLCISDRPVHRGWQLPTVELYTKANKGAGLDIQHAALKTKELAWIYSMPHWKKLACQSEIIGFELMESPEGGAFDWPGIPVSYGSSPDLSRNFSQQWATITNIWAARNENLAVRNCNDWHSINYHANVNINFKLYFCNLFNTMPIHLMCLCHDGTVQCDL